MGFNQRNWVFATNSDILITTSLQPNVLDLRFFKFWILLDQIFKFCNIKDKLQLAYKDMRIRKFESLPTTQFLQLKITLIILMILIVLKEMIPLRGKCSDKWWKFVIVIIFIIKINFINPILPKTLKTEALVLPWSSYLVGSITALYSTSKWSINSHI